MNDSRHKRLDFLFGNEVVGYFVTSLPTRSGRFPYIPYRGPGHFHLGEALQKYGPQECHYVTGEKTQTFKIMRIASYGVLEIEA